MKKIIISIFLLQLFTVSFAQTIVNTNVEQKKVILEEYTGINCANCPGGHLVANEIEAANPGNVFLVNIHAGSFSTPAAGEPDFRTPFGQALLDQTSISSFPSATINRHLFSGHTQTGMTKNYWVNAANNIFAQTSYVNVAVEAEINVQTRLLTVHVETYYTSNSSQNSNYLNVALLQNNTLAMQDGGGVGDEYVHNHRLVHLLTGQWGETISTTTNGTFIDRTYTYSIPANYNSIEAVITDLEIVAFVSETHQEIISGNGCKPTFTNLTFSNDANIVNIEEVSSVCGNQFSPTIIIQNTGNNTLNSIEITYSINNETNHTYNWTGSLPALYTAEVSLPTISFTPQATNIIQASIPDDDDNTNNNEIENFDVATEVSSTINLDILTDNFGDEITWNITNSLGNAIYSGGPYPNGSPIQISQTFELQEDCYTFSIADSYGDGLIYPENGHLYLTDDEGVTLMEYPTGEFGSGDEVAFLIGEGGNVTQNFVLDTIVFRGDTANFINIVYFSDGYTETEIGDFEGQVQSAADYMFTRLPFYHYKNYINIFYVNVISNETGAAENPDNLIDNFFGSTFWYDGLERFLVPTKRHRADSILNIIFPSCDQILFLVNDDMYGGSCIDEKYATSSIYSGYQNTIIHEMGHAFPKPRLADEYWPGDVYAFEAPNMTQESDPDLVPWTNWIGYEGIGVFAHDAPGDNWNKPSQTCKMQNHNQAFCPVCQEAFVKKFHNLSNIIINHTSNENVIYVQNNNLEFQTTVVLPIPNTVTYEWYLNDELIETDNNNITIINENLIIGENHLQFIAQDVTDLIRIDDYICADTVEWTINKEPTDIFLNNSNIRIYPNPTTDFINITNAENSNIYIYDISGKLINNFSVNNKKTSIDLTNYDKGVYFIKIMNNENVEIAKIIVK